MPSTHQELHGPLTADPQARIWNELRSLSARMAVMEQARNRTFGPEYYELDTVNPRSGIVATAYPGSAVAGAPNISITVAGSYYLHFGGLLSNAAAGANDMRVGVFVNNALHKEGVHVTPGAGGGSSIADMTGPVAVAIGDIVDVRYRSLSGASFAAWGGWLALHAISLD